MFTAIIQARVGSKRFKNKIFAELAGKPLIWHVCERLKYSERIKRVILATTNNPLDDVLQNWCKSNNILVFRGNENNVLNRYYEAAKKYSCENIVRITADDPFKDPRVIDRVIDMFVEHNLDFAFNNSPPSFPEGLDTEVFSFDALEVAENNAKTDFEKEHVTQYFHRNRKLFKTKNLLNKTDISNLRWTIDTHTDLLMAKAVYNELYKEENIFLMDDILDLISRNPEIAKINNGVERSTMYK